jgi:hypothetical protein
MPPKPVPQALPLRDAMQQSAPLARLFERLQETQARFDAVREMLPPGLRSQVQPGPVDEQGWCLLAGNAAVAAKLKHLLPLLARRLGQRGFAAVALRVKVLNAR